MIQDSVTLALAPTLEIAEGSLGLLLARVGIGLALAAHGAQKLFGWFGGYGITGTGGWLASMGFPAGRVQAVVSGTSEFGGGLLIAFGLLTPLGGA